MPKVSVPTVTRVERAPNITTRFDPAARARLNALAREALALDRAEQQAAALGARQDASDPTCSKKPSLSIEK